MAIFTAGRAGLKTLLARRLRIAALAAAATALIAGSALAAGHITHYFARASANERSVLAEIMAQPICSGTTEQPKSVLLSYAGNLEWADR